VGYKVHVSETCDEQPPRIITNVKTTLAPIADGEMTTPIHQALQAKDLLPKYHLVDTAYLDAELLVNSQAEYDVNLVGPTRIDTGWQARQTEGGFSANNFVVDWIQQQATCPGGKTSQYWQPAKDTHGMTPSISGVPRKIVVPVLSTLNALALSHPAEPLRSDHTLNNWPFRRRESVKNGSIQAAVCSPCRN